MFYICRTHKDKYMSKYRVIREEFYNGKGISFDTCFFVQQQKSFLFFKWWTYVTHESIGIKSLKKFPLQFKGGVLEAEDFIKEVLIKGNKFKGNYKTVLREYDSNGIKIKL